MYFLRLFSRGNLACPNRPNRLISNNNLRPIFRLLRDSLQLCGNDFDSLVTFSLLQSFSTAQDDTQTPIERGFRLACNELIIPRIVSTSLPYLQPPTPGVSTLLFSQPSNPPPPHPTQTHPKTYVRSPHHPPSI